MIRVFGLLFCALALSAADLSAVRSEANPVRRARLALDAALDSFAQAKSSYAVGNAEKTGKELNDMQSAVEIAQEALDSTGKDPRRHARHFKFAETATRDLLRRLEGLENAMDFEDRKLLEAPKAKVQEVHDEWLNGIITGKR